MALLACEGRVRYISFMLYLKRPLGPAPGRGLMERSSLGPSTTYTPYY